MRASPDAAVVRLYKQIRESHPVQIRQKFNSARKRISSIIRCNDHSRVCVKGAPDWIITSMSSGSKQERTQNKDAI
jgi:magnesium-transporting ATPase (P-type)